MRGRTSITQFGFKRSQVGGVFNSNNLSTEKTNWLDKNFKPKIKIVNGPVTDVTHLYSVKTFKLRTK